MAEPLKNMYNPQFFEKLCPVLCKSIPGFDCRDFIFRIFNNTWPDLELKQRVRQIAQVLHHFLPADFGQASRVIIRLAQNLRQADTKEQGFALIFLADYIEVYGLDHVDESLQAIEEITKLVSAEFAIRPLIARYQEKVMKQMLAWSKHPDANVRRLSSEGCRPRLPWAIGLPAFKNDPSEILPILENLKEDPSEYVRRSVANNLNDIAKDHPELVLKIAKQWQGKNTNTDWIIKHGCRTLLKKGHKQALGLHGFDPNHRASVKELSLLKNKVKIGDYLNFGFNFVSKEKSAVNFRLEYAIDFITSTGKISRKIFKIAEDTFEPGETVAIKRKQSFKDFTTRKHFKGKHFLTILANGKKVAAAEFMVC
ncbi:MAG: DNA alkylation repair protein [Bacteroidota bacterium]